MEPINDYMMKDHRDCDEIFDRARDAADAGDWDTASRAAGSFLARIERHIELEEDLLFPAFEESSGASAGGPTETMRSEHVQMRPLFEQMRSALAAKNARQYGEAAQALHEILMQHNMKEEQMMYPMLDQSLGNDGATRMVAQLRERALSEAA